MIFQEPLFKWPGGKRWLARKLVPFLQDRFIDYFEPFLGGGAFFFYLKPQSSTLSDINPDLINCYRAVKDDAAKVFYYLQKIKACQNNYYYIRDCFKSKNNYHEAARFIFLLSNSWNGLYRVNLKGNLRGRVSTINFEV
jgi:DNA adenine methylase